MYNLPIVHLFPFRRACSQHHLELILIGNIQHFHDFPVRHSFISIKRHIHFRFFRSARLQERSQFFQRNRLLLIISKRRVKIQVLIDNNIDITLLSGGIYEAMITTVGGLIVGIIAMFAYNYLVTLVDGVVNKMEAKTMAFMDLLNEPAS